MSARPTPLDSAKVIQVIQTVTAKGNGTEQNPNRLVTEYWSLDGKRLAVNDPLYEADVTPPCPLPSG